MGLLIMYSMYGTRQCFGLLIFVVCMFPIVKMKNVKLTFVLSMSCLLASFAYIAYFYYLSWRMDFTTSLMGMVIRLHTICCDMRDYDALQSKKEEKNLGKFKR